MISFEPSEEQELARQSVREFARDVVRPLGRPADEDGRLPAGFLARAWALGLVTTQVPEACGGGGVRSPLTSVLVLEELGYGDAALAVAAMAPALFALAIADQGTPPQQARWLPACAGDTPPGVSLALVEPRPAFDPAALDTVAVRRGGGWVLTGTKCCVPLGEESTRFLVVARHGETPGFAGQAAFVVPREAAGLAVRGPDPQLGLRAVPMATLELAGVEVPDDDRLGGAQGCDVRRIVNAARVGQAAVLVGLARAVMDYAIPYAKERVAFGEAIARKQAIAFMLADMAIEVDAMRWLVWKAASQLERGADATRAAHLARGYAAEQAMIVADNGVQVLGGHGFIREHPVELWYRHARTLGVLEGAVTA